MTAPRPSVFQSLSRLLLGAAAALTVILACLPQPPEIPGHPPELLLHGGSFAVLAILARVGHPLASAWLIMLTLAGLGGAIELLQSVPRLQREPSLADWAADLAGIAVTLGGGELISRLSGRKKVAECPRV